MKLRPLLLLSFAAALSCEPYPYIGTKVVLPPGVQGPKERLHIEIASSRDARDLKSDELGPWRFSEIHEESDGFTVAFATTIGGQTFTYAHVWFDVNDNGVLDSGDAVGDLAPAPFHAVDQGMFSCASNHNTAPNIVMVRVP